MPVSDDDLIRIGTQVDVGPLSGGMDQAVNAIQTKLAIAKQEFKTAASDVSQSVNRIVDAQKQMTAAAEAGHQALANGLNQAIEEEKQALDAAIVSQERHRSELGQLRGALEAATQSEDNFTSTVMGTRMAASLLGREIGVAMPMAISSLAARIPALSSALALAFPIITAVGFADILVQIVEKVEDWATGLDKIKEFTETIGKQFEEDKNKIDQFARSTQEAQLRIVALTQGAKAEAQARENLLLSTADKDRTNLDDLRSELVRLQASANAASIKLNTTPAVFTGDRKSAKDTLEHVYADMSSYSSRIEVAQAKLTADMTEAAAQRATVQHDASMDAEKAAAKAHRDAIKAARDAQAELRKADQDAITDIRLDAQERNQTHIETLNQERDYIERRLQVEASYPDRVRQLRSELARVEEESGRIQTEHQKEIARIAEETAKKVTHWNNVLVEMQDGANKMAEKWAQEEQKQLQKTGDLIEQRIALYQESAIQMQGLANQRSNALDTRGNTSLNPFNSDFATKELRQQQALDEQLIQEKIKTIQKLAQLDANDPVKVEQDNLKQAQLQIQLDQKKYESQTRILKLQQQQYQNYFNTINQGFENALNGWIRGNESFAQAMSQMLGNLLVQFADFFLEMGLKAAESWLLQKLLAQTSQSTTAVAEVASNAAVGGSAAAASTAAIPIVGPALAPAAGLATYSSILATYTPLAAFETGGIIPNTGIALVHQGEAVLPARMTSSILNMTNQRMGGDVNVTNNNNFSGSSDTHFAAQLDKHADRIASTVMKSMRRSNLV